VASITKSNAQGYGMVLWDEVFDEVAAEFPDIETESLLIDRAVMEFVRRPESFDVWALRSGWPSTRSGATGSRSICVTSSLMGFSTRR
jgi:hypothetical protein